MSAEGSLNPPASEPGPDASGRDAWDVPQFGSGGHGAYGGHDAYLYGAQPGGGVPGASAPGVSPQAGAGRPDPGRALRVAAVVFFALDAISTVLDLFGPGSQWKYLGADAGTVVFTATAVLAAAMLLPARTRGFGAGFALGQALTQSAFFVGELRPAEFNQFSTVLKVSTIGSFATTTLAGLAVIVALILERGTGQRAARTPVPALALGIPAALLAFFGQFATQYTQSSAGMQSASGCCSWSSSDGFTQFVDVLGAVSVALVAVIAAFARRPGYGKGLLLGALVIVFWYAFEDLLVAAFPNAVFWGIGNGTGEGAFTIAVKAGTWSNLGATAALLVAVLLQRFGAARPAASPTLPPPPVWSQLPQQGQGQGQGQGRGLWAEQNPYPSDPPSAFPAQPEPPQ